MAANMREVIGDARPAQMLEFGDRIYQRLTKDNEAKQAKRERSGKISGGKLAQPTLWSVLDMLGVPREYDPYLLGKFQRGHDVEARAIVFLTDIPMSQHEEIEGKWVKAPKTSLLKGEIMLQKPSGYRGGTGFVDIAQRTPDGTIIYHEIKSSTKMAYDKVAASGRSASTKVYKTINGKRTLVSEQRNQPSPYYHHCVQQAYYCIGDDVQHAFVHYFNADDYRLTTFSIDPMDYKDEIDKEIDDIQNVFLSKQLPVWEGFLDYHKAYKNSTYGEWNDLTPQQMLDKLERDYPEAYDKLITTTLEN